MRKQTAPAGPVHRGCRAIRKPGAARGGCGGSGLELRRAVPAVLSGSGSAAVVASVRSSAPATGTAFRGVIRPTPVGSMIPASTGSAQVLLTASAGFAVLPFAGSPGSPAEPGAAPVSGPQSASRARPRRDRHAVGAVLSAIMIPGAARAGIAAVCDALPRAFRGWPGRVNRPGPRNRAWRTASDWWPAGPLGPYAEGVGISSCRQRMFPSGSLNHAAFSEPSTQTCPTVLNPGRS